MPVVPLNVTAITPAPLGVTLCTQRVRATPALSKNGKRLVDVAEASPVPNTVPPWAAVQ
ncbi:MAG: hypothetical protein M0D57_07265 [Sphingobacteriales bacterium JAD_PAG50586_3]|nr:MAG: hypothetical protein M0D57_07265 [Sphingobacteriales bacterium JAD_PAG50586_3]